MSRETFFLELANWLASSPQNIGVPGETLFLGGWQAHTGPAVLLVETGGTATAGVLRSAYTTCQAVCRADSYEDARNKVWSIYNLLNDRPPPWVCGSTKVMESKAIQSPFFIGLDGQKRAQFSVNFRFLLAIE